MEPSRYVGPVIDKVLALVVYLFSPEPSSVMMRNKSGYSESFTHDVPVSFGVSARFFLTERLTFNTGLRFTF